MTPKVFVSIATYNEKDNIEKLIRQIFGLGVENLSAVIIDDNSPDGTAQIVENLKNEFPALSLIKRSGKLGYGSAHVAGFQKALANGADIVISMDADFSHDPKVIPELISSIEQGNDVVIGSRKVKGGELVGWSPWRKFASAGAMLMSQVILGIQTNDLTSGFRAYRRAVLEKIDLSKIKSDGYSFLEELLYLVEKIGFKIKEIPIVFLDRRLGQSKLSKKEIFKFFITIFRIKFNSIKNFKLNLENSTLILLGLSFFIGIWHAFPLLKVIGDEMYFVGGVLRAMENFSFLPAVDDVPYGTITYYLNYFLIAGWVLILLPFFKFNLTELKDFLVQNPQVIYIVIRLLSALLGLVYLWLFNKIFKKEIKDFRIRIFLLILLFTNMITMLFLHTGKMWVLSILLVLLSFYYLYRALSYKDEITQTALVQRSLFLSILFSFLAVANFPLNAFALVNIPLIFIFFRQRPDLLFKSLKYILIGLAVFGLIILSNFESIKNQILSIFADYHPLTSREAIELSDFGLAQSVVFNLKRLFLFFPLLILTLLLVIKDKVRNKQLFIMGVIYFSAYLSVLISVGTWSEDLYFYIRRLFPLGFFFILIIASFNIKFKKIFYPIALVSLIYFGMSLYFLSVPTTFNQAYNWVSNHLNQEKVVIINEVGTIDLPKNKQSYLLVQDYFCASKCQNVVENDLNSYFKPLIIDKYTQGDVPIPDGADIYYLKLDPQDPQSYELIARFGNNVGQGFAVDGRMANYFDLDFFRIKNFGADIFIYKGL